MRVHELAKELGLNSKELIQKLSKLGVSVKSHMSSLDTDTVTKVKKKLPQKKAPRSKASIPKAKAVGAKAETPTIGGEKKEKASEIKPIKEQKPKPKEPEEVPVEQETATEETPPVSPPPSEEM